MYLLVDAFLECESPVWRYLLLAVLPRGGQDRFHGAYLATMQTLMEMAVLTRTPRMLYELIVLRFVGR
jgi:hypothetical protein